MNKKIVPIFVLLLSFLCNIFPQSKTIDKSYALYEAGEYYQAIDMFKESYDKTLDKNKKNEILFYIGNCYKKIGNPSQAEIWYKKALNKGYNNPVAILFYADVLRMNGKYELAKEQYQQYKQLVPDDPRGENGIISCDLAPKFMQFPTGYQVQEMSFLNSRYNDYAPAFGSADYSVIYFTSSRNEATGKNDHGATGQKFSDIFVSQADRKGKWSVPIPLGQPVNSEVEEGTSSVSFDYNWMYFTRCGFSKRHTMGCEICVVQRQNDKWGKLVTLKLGPDTVVVAHPAISPDGLTLYFVSDMEGSIKNPDGKNSKDIWKVTRNSLEEDWGKPENLGEPINTWGDELFPYVHYDGTLYFSSDGHPGMGGLDIFKAKKNEEGKWVIENMGYPINTSMDDFGIVFEKEREAGYFSSNRKGKGDDDIYSFLLPPLRFSITGIVKNSRTNEPIEEADVKSVSSDGVTVETKTDKKGLFRFTLKPSTDYVFIASKDQFLKGKSRETTKGLNQSTELKTEILLTPIDKPIEVENIYFDFDSWQLRPESMVALDNLVDILRENPNITIELGSHTDSRGDDKYNQELSQKRAQSVVDYLISKGINPQRLIAKGYGESMPKVVDTKDHEKFPFLPVGVQLTEKFINSLKDEEQQEIAHFLNRRTEFKVLRTDFKE